MTARAEGTFTVTSWQEDTHAELGGNEKITEAHMGFRLTGDLAAQVGHRPLEGAGAGRGGGGAGRDLPVRTGV